MRLLEMSVVVERLRGTCESWSCSGEGELRPPSLYRYSLHQWLCRESKEKGGRLGRANGWWTWCRVSSKNLELQSVPRGSVILITSAVINPGSFDIAPSTSPLKGLQQLSEHSLFHNGPSQPRITRPGWRLEEGRCGRAQFRGEDPVCSLFTSFCPAIRVLILRVSPDIRSMFGRRQEAGTHSPRIGKRTRRSWAESSSA